MPDMHDFWGKEEKKIKNQKSKIKIKERWASFGKKIQPILMLIGSFFRRLWRLPRVLNRTDKIALFSLAIILLGLCGYYLDANWLSKNKTVPAVGGTYKEVLIGQAQYLNPILAKSDTDKTIDQLIYSGLTKVDQNGNLLPDLAKSWEISADGKTYTFHLRNDVSWQDGTPFTSDDVAATIADIKTDNIQSPYYDAWKDVVVSTPDQFTVVFTLPTPYGPFLYNTLIGIIPSHLDESAISASPVGTGPYRFSKANSDSNQKISEVILERSDNYYGQEPYISEIDFQIVADETAAKKSFDAFFSPATAIAGLKVSADDSKNYSFATSRDFGLVFNLANSKFKDLNVRKQIKSGQKFSPALSFSMLVLDKPLSDSAAESLKSQYAKQGITINIDKEDAVTYSNLLAKRNFQTVLYGFDTGYDRDPYPFWHSSQIASGDNFSGFSNKDADILLESARMTSDATVRNQKYDQFFAILSDQVPVIFLPPQTFDFTVKTSVLGIGKISGFEPWDHLNGIANWYIKTKRVKP